MSRPRTNLPYFLFVLIAINLIVLFYFALSFIFSNPTSCECLSELIPSP